MKSLRHEQNSEMAYSKTIFITAIMFGQVYLGMCVTVNVDIFTLELISVFVDK